MKYSLLTRVLIISDWLSILLSLHQPSQAYQIQPGDELQAIDSFITQQMHELDIPGIALTVVRGDNFQQYRTAQPSSTQSFPAVSNG